MSVYFIRAGEAGPVKIGFAKDVERRRAQLQTSHSEDLRVIRVADGGRDIERWLHRRFADQHRRAEWFSFHPDMLTVEPVLMVEPPSPPAPHKDPALDAWRKSLCSVLNPCAECRRIMAIPGHPCGGDAKLAAQWATT